MQGSRIMKATIVAVVMSIGILAIPVGASSPKTASSTTHSSSGTAVAAGPAAVGTTSYALNTMQNVPVAGTAAGGKVFRGTVDIVNFRNINGRLTAIGSLTGRLVGPAGTVLGRVADMRVRMPVTLSDGINVHTSLSPSAVSCDILHLRLGAIDLDLLGLVVHLDPVRLDITAQPGPGNLLGNLLCAVTHLLDNANVNDVLVSLLRAILQILNGL